VSEGIGPRPEGGYPVAERPTYPGPTRERWAWTAVVVSLGLLIFGLIVFGLIGGPKAAVPELQVSDVLDSPNGQAARFGSQDLLIVGWYTQVSGSSCSGDTGGSDPVAGWLQAQCPVRVLVPVEPTNQPTQAELLRDGLPLAAPNGAPFPPPTAVGSGTAGLEQLVFHGHFDDSAAASCIPDRVERCRNTFVVSDYTGLIR
jgi:hypothetical protein